jgi:hypothetical protein
VFGFAADMIDVGSVIGRSSGEPGACALASSEADMAEKRLMNAIRIVVKVWIRLLTRFAVLMVSPMGQHVRKFGTWSQRSV